MRVSLARVRFLVSFLSFFKNQNDASGVHYLAGELTSVFFDEEHWIGCLEFGDLAPADFNVRRLSIFQHVALLRVISSRPRH
jgi:hypothetical protein